VRVINWREKGDNYLDTRRLAVYILMQRQQKQLSDTAGRLANILESYMANRETGERFENPHLVSCYKELGCEINDCPMYGRRDERCWQVMALSDSEEDPSRPRFEIEKCYDCDIYLSSCPDKFTELGESFNNLLFLLSEEARRVGFMRAQMIEKEKLVSIGQLASGIAHEIGNPLSSISSIVQILKRSGQKESMDDQLDLIATHIQRIAGTVRHLSKLAHPENGRWEIIDTGRVLEEAIRLISFDKRASNVDIELRPPPPSLKNTCGQAGQLEQVFINLAINALDAMPDGGKLTFEIREDDGNIIITVTDTGCGIPEETGKRIIEPFFTTKEMGRGTGLGLAVSHSIIRKHGGTFDFLSAVGKGTTFTITLPILKTAPE
jgi:signal transduction histidine kinase